MTETKLLKINTILRVSIFTSSLIFSLIVLSCRHKGDIPTQPQVSFSQQVQPIIVSNCSYSGCHSANDRHPRPLVSYSDVMDITVPGDAHGSEIYQRITELSSNKMPPDHNMTESQIIIIYTWIMQGAQNN